MELEKIKNLNKDIEIIGDGTSIIETEVVPVKHSFADGIYVRQMSINKGVAVLGAIHNHQHVWFLLTGHLTISCNNEVQDYEAPCYVVSEPGSQRAIYANEDSIFVNIHKNPKNTQDIKELEKEIVSITKEDFNNYIKNKV